MIANVLSGLGEMYRAAPVCDILVTGGYDDWYLPSKGELDLMFRNLKQQGLGGFSNGTYWSSSEYSNLSAWTENFSNGGQDSEGKANNYAVRAVRAF
jgi:hypothetical protein